MTFIEAMRIKYGKKSGNMDEVDQYFASLGTQKFRAIGAAVSKAGRRVRNKPLKMGQQRKLR